MKAAGIVQVGCYNLVKRQVSAGRTRTLYLVLCRRMIPRVSLLVTPLKVTFYLSTSSFIEDQSPDLLDSVVEPLVPESAECVQLFAEESFPVVFHVYLLVCLIQRIASPRRTEVTSRGA